MISEELNRLRKGFESNVNPNSKLKNFADSLLELKVPDWHKSKKWLVSVVYMT